jgi:N-acetylglucosaminylphosphatidylinositol deacetylase
MFRVADSPSDRQEPVFTLTTTGVLRKYSSVVDMPLTLLGFMWSRDATLSVNSFSMWWQGVRAFRQHKTQNSWDRYLYAVLSRYMWFNTLELVD